MKALVVGGSGFLGSHVADALLEAGHEVTIYDLRPSPHRTGEQRFLRGDILDPDRVREALSGQEVVYNFAGLADLDEAQRQPVETVRTNILGNTILLEEIRNASIQRTIFASTIYVSGHAGGFYRASKQACELYVEEYQRWFGLDYTILRYGSIYGRRADVGNGVRRYLLQALRNRRIVLAGTGEELREYVHVTDVARASVQILDSMFRNETVLLTGHHPMRLKDLAVMIREIVGLDVRIENQPVESSSDHERPLAHYTITPYAFRPRLPKKLVSPYYVDMGQGLIDCLEEIHEAEPKPI
jgi:UDP-glucose 4-epimerase